MEELLLLQEVVDVCPGLKYAKVYVGQDERQIMSIITYITLLDPLFRDLKPSYVDSPKL